MYTQIILLVGFSLVITLLMFNAKGVERFSDIAVIGLAVLVTLVLSTLGTVSYTHLTLPTKRIV